jgi:hypothetical protein
MNSAVENVFVCTACDLNVICVVDAEEATCHECGKSMQEAGWIETCQ